MKNSTKKKIAIILCTYNPNINFLKKQLSSLEKQTNQNFKVYVHDDKSEHNISKEIESLLKSSSLDYSLSFNQQRMGFAKNFFYGLLKADAHKYFSFCDQDDIWMPGKIEKSLQFMNNYDLYCSSTLLINKLDKVIGHNNLRAKPSFKNALVQSIAGGNTFLFKSHVRNLISNEMLNKKIVSHDWLLYLLAAGNGCRIFYDFNPSVYYRLHSKNTIGTSFSLKAKTKRLLNVYNNTFQDYISSNIDILHSSNKLLSEINRKLLVKFCYYRSSNTLCRLAIVFKLGIKRASYPQTLMLIIALLFKKI
jgi:glycosyltransferase involved in cell wall biosynthesis